MKKMLSLFVMTAAAATFAFSASAAEVHTQAFTIDLPHDFPAFEKKNDVQKAGDGNIETTTWISRSPSTAEAVVIAVSTMPGKILDPQKLFDKTRDALLASLKGTLENDESSSQAVPARRLLMRTPNAFIRARLMTTGARLYQILYVARASEHRSSPEVSNMFASLHLDDSAAPAGSQ
jgi:hypothetical protein